LPKRIVLTAGSGVGTTPVNAFDAALLDGGVGDLNLVKVSSIVPVGAEVMLLKDRSEEHIARLAKGTIVPAVYGMMFGEKAGQRIASALAVGLPRESGKNGVIFEAATFGDKTMAETIATDMVKEALASRGVGAYEVLTVSAELTINDRVGCVVSIAVLLPE